MVGKFVAVSALVAGLAFCTANAKEADLTGDPVEVNGPTDRSRPEETAVHIIANITLRSLTEAQWCEGPYELIITYTAQPYDPEAFKKAGASLSGMTWSAEELDFGYELWRSTHKAVFDLKETGEIRATITPPANATLYDRHLELFNAIDDKSVAALYIPYCQAKR